VLNKKLITDEIANVNFTTTSYTYYTKSKKREENNKHTATYRKPITNLVGKTTESDRHPHPTSNEQS